MSNETNNNPEAPKSASRFSSPIVVWVLIVLLLLFCFFQWNQNTQLQKQVTRLEATLTKVEHQRKNSPLAQVLPPEIMEWSTPFFQDSDPFSKMHRIVDFFDSNWRRDPLIKQTYGLSSFSPKVNILETNTEYLVTMDIPGMEKDQISVQIDNGQLIVSGERKATVTEGSEDQYFRHEVYYGEFKKELTLPEDADTSQIKAQYQKGVLELTIAKKASATVPAKVVSVQ